MDKVNFAWLSTLGLIEVFRERVLQFWLVYMTAKETKKSVCKGFENHTEGSDEKSWFLFSLHSFSLSVRLGIFSQLYTIIIL